MSRVNPDVDLAALARTPNAAVPPPRRRPLRIVVPLLLVGGFAAVLLSTLDDLFTKAVDVVVVRPRLVAADAAATDAGGGATPLLQAAGWVEPDPYAFHATALVPGVCAEVLALESAVVKKGDVVARLVDDEAKLQLSSAEAEVARAAAELRRATVETRAAAESFDAALAVTEADRAAKAEAAGKVAEARGRAEAVRRGEALVRIAAAELALQKDLAEHGATSPWALELAAAKLEEARGELGALHAEHAVAEADAEKAAATASRAARDKELRIDDRRARDGSAAAEAAAQAALAVAEAAAAEARLALDRTTIRAPEDGVVLERHVEPGHAVREEDPRIVTLFDPARLRIRVDVPQGDVGKAAVGQRAEIRSEARGDRPYKGEVVRLVQKADIQKVTLQAHVKVTDGDAALRPEMLCQVRFFAAEGAASRAGGDGPTRIFVPARLVRDGHVWTLDPLAPRAKRVRVEIGATSGEFVEIRSGVDASSKLLDGAGLTEGAPVRATGG